MHRLPLAVLFALAPAMAQSLNGLWDATVTVNGVAIPFRMEFANNGASAKGTFFNGDEKLPSTAGRFEKGELLLKFDYYAATLQATWKGGLLEGTYQRTTNQYPFRAKRFAPSTVAAADVPDIAGLWEVGVKSPKGESAWRFIVRQSGPEVSAAI